MFNLFEVFRQMAKRRPRQIALVDCDLQECMSYGELLEEVERFAQCLQRGKLRAGQCIGLHVPSGRNYILATYAAWKCGVCVVPIPMELSTLEKQLICASIAQHGMLTCATSTIFWQSWQRGDAIRLGPLEMVLLKPAIRPPAGLQDINAAFIRFSSGTTGDAKGVVLSHETILERIHAANEGLHIGPRDRVAWLLSMSYHFAASIVAYLSFGATVILPKRELNLGGAFIDAASRYEATLIYGSPLQYKLMAMDRGNRRLDTARIAISTASSLSRDTAESFYKRFGIALSQVYGLIEVGLPCMNLRFPYEHYDSVGQMLPAFELRLIDSGHGGHLKEIQLRGRGFLDAYYDPWQTRRQIMPDGWFHTGDLGEVNEDGCLFIRGRSKEVINVGGMKVFPREVEAVLQLHPAIKEVAVFGVRQMRSRESLWADVVIHPEVKTPPKESELRQFCAKQLAHYKVPERIALVPQLARTASGKVLRRAVESA